MPDDQAMAAIAAALGHPFERPEGLRDALTHRSFAHEKPTQAPNDNERLEFLGDAILGAIVSDLLFEHYPEAPEGELTRRRADLVCEASLACIARDIGIGDALRLGVGEERSGGRDKARLLASALEACFGAVYLDGGSEAATALGRKLLGARIDAAAPGRDDYKSRVQELVQRRGQAPPTYEVVTATGPDHARVFEVAVLVAGERLARGSGRSKAEAEQAAARGALDTLTTLD